MKKEVRFAGFGGQGVILAGVVLGTAAVSFDGKTAVQTQSYGAEARGGGARSELIISDQPIIYPRVTSPDVMVAMSAQAVKKYHDDLKKGALLIVDSDLVKEIPRKDLEEFHVPATEMAGKELGRVLVANMVMLGALVTLTGIVSHSAVKKAIELTVPKGTAELNLKAFDKGCRWVDNNY